MGLYRTSAARRTLSRAALSTMASSIATPAFQHAGPASAQFRSFHSWIPDRPACLVADSVGDRRLGARSTCWSAQLARVAKLGHARRHISAHGLCLLVVALGQSHGPAFLAIP